MSKRSRHSDNSKRQQPVQQQRAQARQTGSNGPAKAPQGEMKSSREDESGSAGKK